MKTRIIVIGLCCSVLILGCRELSRAPSSAIYIAPSHYNGALPQIAGDYTVNPTWNIAQWGITQDLTGTQTVAPNKDWEIANTFGSVKYLSAGKTYELGQNGQAPGAQACGTEYDLFLQPNTSVYPGYPIGISPSKQLDKLENLGVRIGVDIMYEQINSRCPLNYASYAVAFIFSAPATGQTLFYGVTFRDSRNLRPDMSWCPGYEGPGYKGQYCVDDGLHLYNETYLTVGESRRQLLLDILPKVARIIQSGHTKTNSPGETIDTEMSHWQLDGVYMGQALQGGTISASKWDSFCLIEKEVGDNANNTVCGG